MQLYFFHSLWSDLQMLPEKAPAPAAEPTEPTAAAAALAISYAAAAVVTTT